MSGLIWKLPNNSKIVLCDTQNTANVFFKKYQATTFTVRRNAVQ